MRGGIIMQSSSSSGKFTGFVGGGFVFEKTLEINLIIVDSLN